MSADPVGVQKEFKEENDFDYPLLSDTDGSVHKALGTKRWGPLPGKRATFVIGTDFRILEVVKSEVSANVHADQALEALRAHAA